MKNLKHNYKARLESLIREGQDIIAEYEELLKCTKDPVETRRYNYEINRLKKQIEDYQKIIEVLKIP